MAKFMILIYGEEGSWAAGGPETEQALEGYRAFGERHGPAILGGEGLMFTTTATSLRQGPDGGFTVTDGPFVETKEALGGYYLLEAPDLDAAIALAKEIPAPFGGVEVRPVQVFD